MIYRTIVILLIFLPMSGCGIIFGADYTNEFMNAIMVKETKNGYKIFDDSALSGALLRKFPIGSPASAVTEFTKNLHGRCTDYQKDMLSCRIPVYGQICYETDVEIEVFTNDQLIRDLKTSMFGVGC